MLYSERKKEKQGERKREKEKRVHLNYDRYF